MGFERADIKVQKLIYHITDLINLEPILSEGIKPRCELVGFSDVADPDILAKRKRLKLDEKVPFHFFVNNPFDGGVVKSNPTKKFVILGVQRSRAQAENWCVIPRHPLAHEQISLMGYVEGFNQIDWIVMNERDYNDANGKSVCMAECLAPTTVSVTDIFSIYVNSDECETTATELVRKYRLGIRVNKRPNMFPRIK